MPSIVEKILLNYDQAESYSIDIEENLQSYNDSIKSLRQITFSDFKSQSNGVLRLLTMIHDYNMLENIPTEIFKNTLTPLYTYVDMINEFEKNNLHYVIIQDLFEDTYMRTLENLNYYLSFKHKEIYGE